MREVLLDKLKQLQSIAPDIPPIVSLDEYFVGNTDEECIAWNQIGYGRPSVGNLYERFKEIQQKSEVQIVLVGLHFDWTESFKNENMWPVAENIHIYTSASLNTVVNWIDGLEADCIIEGWTYGKHPTAPVQRLGFAIYSICWD